MRSTFAILALCLCGTLASVASQYQYEVKYYLNMPVDHFSFTNETDTFPMRYAISDKYWDRKAGPIFFYCGNEGDILMFANNTGLMWDLAPEFGAMVVFAEHRYYGSTLPYGNKSFENLGKLTSEQALADYATFLTWLKENTPGAAKSPVISFGGSYGGILSAWIRVKYPHIVTGSIASAAPLSQFYGPGRCWTYPAVVTKDFRDAVPGCDEFIQKSWTVMLQKLSTADGRQWINENFHLCNDSLMTSQASFGALYGWVLEIYYMLAMVNYPYPTSFVAPVPGWPVKEACNRIIDSVQKNPGDDGLLLGIHNALEVLYNYTGATPCFSFTNYGGVEQPQWVYQVCTEMTMPTCYTDNDMFLNAAWNATSFSDSCFKKYQVRPRYGWTQTNYGGLDLSGSSNIVLSNGLLDPCYPGGLLHNISDSVVAILIKDAAHHYDLRGKHPQDTVAIREARQIEANYIRKWIDEHRGNVKAKEELAEKMMEFTLL